MCAHLVQFGIGKQKQVRLVPLMRGFDDQFLKSDRFTLQGRCHYKALTARKFDRQRYQPGDKVIRFGERWVIVS